MSLKCIQNTRLLFLQIQGFYPTVTKFKMASGRLQSYKRYLIIFSMFQHVNNPSNLWAHTRTSTHTVHDSYIHTKPYAHMHTRLSKTSAPSLLLVLWHLTWLMLCSGPGVAWSSGSHWSARREGRQHVSHLISELKLWPCDPCHHVPMGVRLSWRVRSNHFWLPFRQDRVRQEIDTQETHTQA